MLFNIPTTHLYQTGPPQLLLLQGGHALDSMIIYLPMAWSYSRFKGTDDTQAKQGNDDHKGLRKV
jgi:hypothetical protein